MATVKYHGEFPADREEIVQHGYTFERGHGVTVDDPALLARFAANRFFEVSDEAEVKRGPGRPRKEAE